MAVFVSASDESDGGHHRSKFWHGGWLAPETDWYTYFAPAWQERVLDSEPKIPFLHMTDIRDPQWLSAHHITWDEAQEKLDAAAVTIAQMGSLHPIATNSNAGAFIDAHGKKKIVQNIRDKRAYRYLVDHFSFNVYVFAVLDYIHHEHPSTEKVDFVVELKEGVFDKLKQFYDTFADSLAYLHRPELIKYLGELTAVSKERIPVQAADMLCWHISRADLGLLKGRDELRAAMIFNRYANPIDIQDEIHFALAKKFMETLNESKDGVSKVRRHNERTNPGAS